MTKDDGDRLKRARQDPGSAALDYAARDWDLDSDEWHLGEVVEVDDGGGTMWWAPHRLVVEGEAFGRCHLYFGLTADGFFVPNGSIQGLPTNAIVGRAVQVRFAMGVRGTRPEVVEVRAVEPQ